MRTLKYPFRVFYGPGSKQNRGFLLGAVKRARRCNMERKGIITGVLGAITGLLVLLMISAAWAGDSVTISMSLTIPSIPGVNAPARIPETVMRDYQRKDVARNNTAATVGEEFIEKEESKETLLAQGEKVTTAVKTIYTR
jgi:hypothetical protein